MIEKFLERDNLFCIISSGHGLSRKDLNKLLDRISKKYYPNIFYFANEWVNCERIRPRTINKEQQGGKELPEKLPIVYNYNKAIVAEALYNFLVEDGFGIKNIYSAGDSLFNDGRMFEYVKNLGGFVGLITSNPMQLYEKTKKDLNTIKAEELLPNLKSVGYLLNESYPSLETFMQSVVFKKSEIEKKNEKVLSK